MKALLIQPPHTDREPSLFPLGLGYIAGALLDSGWDVEVLDIHALNYRQEEAIEKIEAIDYDFVGINAFATQYKYIRWLTENLKAIKPDKKIVMGGPLPSSVPNLVLKNTRTDICVIGEGDITIRSLIKNLESLDKVKGICFKDNGNIKENPPQEPISDLDTIGFPPYDIFPMDIYFEHMRVWDVPNPGKRAINIVTSRGCPYNCNFCFKTIKGSRLRSIENIVAEIKKLKNDYNIKGIVFSDELVVVSKKRGHELCDKIKDLDLEWGCQARANTVDLDLLRYMKKCGCKYVGYGIESCSQKILNNMNKHVTVKQNETAIRNTIKAGLYPIVQMIFGYPGEDRETIQETIDFFKKMNYPPPHPFAGEVAFSLITPLPGTVLYKQAFEKNILRDEEEYLMNIEKGYSRNCPALVNFTAFDNEELLRQKEQMERKIGRNYRNYLFLHPVLLLKDLLIKLTFKIKNLIIYKSKYGYGFVFKKSILKLRKMIKRNETSPESI